MKIKWEYLNVTLIFTKIYSVPKVSVVRSLDLGSKKGVLLGKRQIGYCLCELNMNMTSVEAVISTKQNTPGKSEDTILFSGNALGKRYLEILGSVFFELNFFHYITIASVPCEVMNPYSMYCPTFVQN